MIRAFCRTVFRHVGPSLVLCWLPACSEGAAPEQPLPSACEQVDAKRRSCGLGPFICETKDQRCFAECLVGFGCAELTQPNIDPGIAACSWACSPRFTCNDGTQIYSAFLCDGEGDCADSEDEMDCHRPSGPALVDKDAAVPAYEPSLDGSLKAKTDGGDGLLADDAAAASAGPDAQDSATQDSATQGAPSGDAASLPAGPSSSGSDVTFESDADSPRAAEAPKFAVDAHRARFTE